MKVLVTGGCGLIGSHAAAYYKEQGHEVHVMDNLERSHLLGHDDSVGAKRVMFNRDRLGAMGISVYTLDVANASHWKAMDSMCEPDVIIHCAAQCGVPTSIADPMRDFEVNAAGTLHMLEFARKHNSIVVYASTNKVYPIHGDDQWFLEDNRWRWVDGDWHKHGVRLWEAELHQGSRTPYGISKYLGDLYCQEYADKYGLKTGVFRMSCIYGDHQFGFEEQGWAAWFTIAVLKGEPIKIYGDGKQVRDMLYVTDAVRAYDSFVKAAKNGDVTSGVWNLGGGPDNTMSLNECLETLFIETGESSEITYHDWRPSDQKIYTSDIRPIKDALGWEPEISVEEGMRNMIDWVSKWIHIF